MTEFLEQNANSEFIASQLAKEIMINLGPEAFGPKVRRDTLLIKTYSPIKS